MIVGKQDLIEACRELGAPNQRISRPMKVGKEEMCGLLAAVEWFLSQVAFIAMCASLLVASGVDIATAAAILGHKRASVLLDIYAKALRAPKRDAAAKLQATLDAAGSVLALPALPLPAPVAVAS